jgi:hypothetical protein
MFHCNFSLLKNKFRSIKVLKTLTIIAHFEKSERRAYILFFILSRWNCKYLYRQNISMSKLKKKCRYWKLLFFLILNLYIQLCIICSMMKIDKKVIIGLLLSFVILLLTTYSNWFCVMLTNFPFCQFCLTLLGETQFSDRIKKEQKWKNKKDNLT